MEKKDKATNTFFLLEILPQMIKICNKMKQPNGNLGASAISWTASKLAVGKAPCGKRVKNDMAPAVWNNMLIWFDLNYVDPESISDIISSYFIYNRSSAYQDYCNRMDLNDYSIYITEIQLPPTYTGHSLFQSKQLGRFVANHQLLSAPTATFLVVCSKTLSLSISPEPGQGWCRGAIEVILRHANIVLAGHSHRTKSAHPKTYSTRFNLLLDHFPRCFMDFKKDLNKQIAWDEKHVGRSPTLRRPGGMDSWRPHDVYIW